MAVVFTVRRFILSPSMGTTDVIQIVTAAFISTGSEVFTMALQIFLLPSTDFDSQEICSLNLFSFYDSQLSFSWERSTM